MLVDAHPTPPPVIGSTVGRRGVDRDQVQYRWTAGEVPVQVLFQRPPARTRRASFPSNGLSSDRYVRDLAGAHPPSRRTSRTVSAFCITHTSRMVMSDHLVCFALWTAFPPSLAGRDSCDYYQTSVAIGLASRRRSLVRPCCTCRAERRWPTHLLECPHWASPAPRRLRRQKRDTDAGHGTGSGVFPVDGGLHQLEIRLQAIQLSPYSAGPAAPHTPTPGRDHCFPGMLLSPSPFRIQVSHQTQEPPSEFLPAASGIQQGAARRTAHADDRAR